MPVKSPGLGPRSGTNRKSISERLQLGNALRRKTLFLFDLDGVLYKGKEVREKIGGTYTVEALRRSRKKLLVLTNNSTDAVETIHERLMEFQIHVHREEILTSALLTAKYLESRYGKVRYFLVGEAGLEAEMKKCGHVRTNGDGTQFVVVGLDRALTYQKLDCAARLATAGAPIVATHSARFYMYNNGPAMATGPVVKALEYAARTRATIIGKPSPLMFQMALEHAGCLASEAVMVGDQVDTDLRGAAKVGIESLLVTTGVDKNARGIALATFSSVDEIADLLRPPGLPPRGKL